jgi:hypothetical protein
MIVGFHMLCVLYVILVIVIIANNRGVQELLAKANAVQYYDIQSHLSSKRDFVRVEKIINRIEEDV